MNGNNSNDKLSNHNSGNHSNSGNHLSSNGESSGKKFTFPVVKSKLDKYKKKIIKKDPKEQTNNNLPSQ